MNKISETKVKIGEWIGGQEFIDSLTDEQAEQLLFWLEENDISIENENDLQKATDYIKELQHQ